jgi:chromate reductase, NAD(P)H dehydrogenase (quinone)
MNKKLLILSSSPRTNFSLAQDIAVVAHDLSLDTEIIDLEALNLPLYTPEVEAVGIPEAAITLTKTMLEYRAFVLLAAEYNGGLPPVVVNAISWISRATSDWRGAFNQKPFMIGTYSGGGGHKVLQIMNMQLQHLGAIVLPRPLMVNSQKPFSADAAKANLAWLANYLG